MKPLRVAIVTRRFWPLAGRAGKGPGQPGRPNCSAAASHATILTAHWQPAWPAELLFQDVPVVRLAPPPQGRWKTLAISAIAGPLAADRMRTASTWSTCRSFATRPTRPAAPWGGRAGGAAGRTRGAPKAIASGSSTPPAAGESSGSAWQRRAWWPPRWPPSGNCEAAGYPRRRHRVSRRRRGHSAAAHARRRRPPPAACWPKPIRRCNFPNGPSWPSVPAACRRAGSWTACWPPGGRWRASCPVRRLWLVGPAADRPAVRRQIERLQLARPGAVWPAPSTSIDELLAAADLLVAPSPEGSPVTLLEAMAAGLPIMAADTAANRSVLTDGQEGLLVAADDAAALSAAMARLCQEPELAARLGQRRPGSGRGRVLSCQNGRPARNMVRKMDALMETFARNVCWGGSCTVCWGGSCTVCWGGSCTVCWGGSCTVCWGGSCTAAPVVSPYAPHAEAAVQLPPQR